MRRNAGKDYKRTRIINDYALSLVRKIVIVIFGLAITVIISRYLGPDKKGQYAIITNYSRIAVTILQLGMTSIFAYIKKSERKNESTLIFFTMMEALIVLAICECLAFFDHNLNFIQTATLFVLPFELICEQVSGISMLQDYRQFSILTMISYGLNCLLCMLLWWVTSSNVWLVLLAAVIKYVFVAILGLIIVKNNTIWTSVRLNAIPHLIKMGIIPMLTSLLGMFNYQIDVIMLDLLNVNYSNVGLYSTAVTIAQIVWMVPDAFKESLSSNSTKYDVIKEVPSLCRIAITFGIICLLGAVVLGKPIILIAFGKDYLGCYTVMLILLVGSIPMVYFKIIGVYYQVNGHFIFQFIVLILSVILNVILNYILIPHFDIIGAGIASIVSYMIAGGCFVVRICLDYQYKWWQYLIMIPDDFRKIHRMIRKQ